MKRYCASKSPKLLLIKLSTTMVPNKFPIVITTEHLQLYFSEALTSGEVLILVFSVWVTKDKSACRNGTSDKNNRQCLFASWICFLSKSLWFSVFNSSLLLMNQLNPYVLTFSWTVLERDERFTFQFDYIDFVCDKVDWTDVYLSIAVNFFAFANLQNQNHLLIIFNQRSPNLL